VKPIDKRALVAKLRAELAREIAAARAAQKDTQKAATHEEAKPENDKDTRALEQSYLARGQAERVRDLERADNMLEFLVLRACDKGALGALVELECDGARTVYFLAPVGGAVRTTIDDVVVQVVTPEAPMGRALIGREAGDVVEVRGKELEIVEVR
jgi:transcription elongation GreA/GreB family factor